MKGTPDRRPLVTCPAFKKALAFRHRITMISTIVGGRKTGYLLPSDGTLLKRVLDMPCACLIISLLHYGVNGWLDCLCSFFPSDIDISFRVHNYCRAPCM